MKPTSLLQRTPCFVRLEFGAVTSRSIAEMTCFGCAEKLGLISAVWTFLDNNLADVPREDPGAGGMASTLASLWRNSVCVHCGRAIADADEDARRGHSLMLEGWSPDRCDERILVIEDRGAYLSVGRMVKAALAGEVDAGAWERAARLATNDETWSKASEEDRLRAVAWAQGLDEVQLPHLAAVWAPRGSYLDRGLTEIVIRCDASGELAHYARSAANGSYLAAQGWFVIPRAEVPAKCPDGNVRSVAWRRNSWIVGQAAAEVSG